jgi:hypothetical protein
VAAPWPAHPTEPKQVIAVLAWAGPPATIVAPSIRNTATVLTPVNPRSLMRAIYAAQW